MVNMLMVIVKIYNIILGTLKNIFRIYPDFSYGRLKKCNKCKNMKYHILLGNYCDICGCIIKSKITIKKEKCPINKW